MMVEINDCFHRDWVNKHIRAGTVSPRFKTKYALLQHDLEAELATRDKDILVEYFQELTEQHYMVSWADSDYMLELYDRTYKRLNEKMVGYDWFNFTVESDNIISLHYSDTALEEMLKSGY